MPRDEFDPSRKWPPKKGWRLASAELPPPYEDVLVWALAPVDGPYAEVAYYDPEMGNGTWLADSAPNLGLRFPLVIYWMPLPEPPK